MTDEDHDADMEQYPCFKRKLYQAKKASVVRLLTRLTFDIKGNDLGPIKERFEELLGKACQLVTDEVRNNFDCEIVGYDWNLTFKDIPEFIFSIKPGDTIFVNDSYTHAVKEINVKSVCIYNTDAIRIESCSGAVTFCRADDIKV